MLTADADRRSSRSKVVRLDLRGLILVLSNYLGSCTNLRPWRLCRGRALTLHCIALRCVALLCLMIDDPRPAPRGSHVSDDVGRWLGRCAFETLQVVCPSEIRQIVLGRRGAVRISFERSSCETIIYTEFDESEV